MKTAMQELIDEMNEMLIDGNGSIYVLKEQARWLLRKEKEQIMDAHSDGALHTDWDENTSVIENAQDYYIETFNNEER